jgi:very-short-patch-repair endonuclease
MLRLALPLTANARGFFTRDELLATAWTPRAIRTNLAKGAWRQLAPGRYVESSVFTALTRERQHRLLAMATGYDRNLVIRRDSAACVYGFSVARTPTIVSTRNVRDFAARDITSVHNVSVTTPACTVIDCARFLGPREGLVVADSALRHEEVNLSTLAGQLAVLPPNGKGTAAAAFVAAEADPRSETAFESISRYEFIVAGLPRPEPNVWIGKRRVDFLWERYRLIGEADGLGKYGKDEAEVRANIRAERERQRELEDAGYVFVRWLWEEMWYRPLVVVARVLKKLEAAGYSAS